MWCKPTQPSRGFTLVEVLVALGLMALLTLMSWRGLDAMLRVAQVTRANGTDLGALQVGLAQWAVDLDRVLETPDVAALDWDGRVLRLVRSSPVGSAEALLVVAWTPRMVAGAQHWTRWQSAPVSQRSDLLNAWQQAAIWARTEGDMPTDFGRTNGSEGGASAVAVMPLGSWQLAYHAGGEWVASNTLVGSGGGRRAPQANAVVTNLNDTPEGLRLLLELPSGGPLQGRLSIDWFNPASVLAR